MIRPRVVVGADGAIYALELEQRYQDVTGTMTGAGQVLQLEGGQLRGKDFAFRAGGRAYGCTIEEAAMTGIDGEWRAVRTG